MRRYRRLELAGATYFFTLVTEHRRPLLREPTAVAMFMKAIETIRARHPFTLHAYVILPDHLHALWELPEGDANFSTRWRLIKEAFTRAYIKSGHAPPRSESRRSKGEQAIWQRRFWEHVIRDEGDFNAHLDYIHFNPVKHGLVTDAAAWRHSSFAEWVARGCYDPSWGTSDVSLPEWVGRE
jgi:putative transposase